MSTPTAHHRRPRPEDQRFLEALCLWRGLYAHRGPQDKLVVATVEDTITAAEMRIHLRRMRDEQMLRRFAGGMPR
ncbi:MAG: hypothetical protein M3Y29_02900 [Chloroflexota bacterium]|nr:hypothetical protein [Chloroflexota bacterium]